MNDFYGLSEAPFALTPDPRFYYASAGQRRAMAYLGYGLAQAEGFVVITGEIGAGKSTLVSHLMATVDPVRVTVGTITQTQVDDHGVLQLALRALGLDPGVLGKAELIDALAAFLRAQARTGRKTLLVVDEAQLLPAPALEALRLLSNLSENGRALIQLLLLGQPEFRDRLEQEPGLEQLRQRVIAQHHLDAMAPAEVEPYIVHRLTCAGWAGRPSFSADAFAALHRESGGIPRRINLLAAQLLLLGAVSRRDTLTGADVDTVAAEMAHRVAAVTPGDEPAIAGAGAAADPVTIDEPAFDPVTDDRYSEAERAWVRRVELLEQRVEEQDAAMRRMLVLMTDLVDRAPQPASRAA